MNIDITGVLFILSLSNILILISQEGASETCILVKKSRDLIPGPLRHRIIDSMEGFFG